MSAHALEIRRTIEALRSGVPSDAAVNTLGSTQKEIENRFLAGIKDKGQRNGTLPLVIDANFGDGKSHLLHRLRVLAHNNGFATASVVIGADAPIGNAHTILKTIAESAEVPGHTGKALSEMAAAQNRENMASLRLWAQDAAIEDRFRALLRVYEATQDEELRVQILDDIEGKPLLKSRIAVELRALGETSHYDLKSPKNTALAHDRIKIFAEFCRVHGFSGLIVFFDEVERIANFTFKSRLAAYQEIGWWRRACESADVPIYAVFAQTSGAIEQCLIDKGDESRLRTSLLQDGLDDLALEGIGLLRKTLRLERASRADLEALQYGVRDLYAQAYGGGPPPVNHRPAWTTIRSEIRRWITEWDMARHFPGYVTDVETADVPEDNAEISDELLDGEDGVS